LRLPSDLADWFRKSLDLAISELTAHRRKKATAFAKRRSEEVTMQDRPLNASLSGTIEDGVYKAKLNELQSEARRAEEELTALGNVATGCGKIATTIFDFAQNAAEK
jgi:hypothetical protein